MRRIALDVAPLRVSRDFRLIWGGLFISELGYQFTLVAVYVQVYALTGSPAAVGLIGLFSFVGARSSAPWSRARSSTPTTGAR